jgi:Na+-transporting methylmalonyl-CoA/oxaloacetate decarboxylase gamma subunit
MNMEHMDFGLTLTVLGMGGTLIILFLISLVVDGLNKFFIHGDRKREARKES